MKWDNPKPWKGTVSRNKTSRLHNMKREIKWLQRYQTECIIMEDQRCILFRPKFGPWIDFYPSTCRFRVVGIGRLDGTFDGDAEHIVNYINEQSEKHNEQS